MSKLLDNPEQPHLHQFVAVKPLSVRRLVGRLIIMLIVIAASVLVHGFYLPPLPEWGFNALQQMGHIFRESDEQLYVTATRILQFVLIAVYWADVAYVAYRRGNETDRRFRLLDWVLLATIISGSILHLFNIKFGWDFVEVSAVILAVTDLWRLNAALARKLKRPGILLPLSFFALIAIGTPLLKLPHATPPGHTISWVDACFTITSAVCVTGLAVKDTAHDFTPFGQTVIAIFIQLGGLGIIIFASMFAMLLGRSLSVKENVSLSQMLNDQPIHKLTSFVRFIVVTTVIIELIGALLLLPMWHSSDDQPLTVAGRFGMSLFHAISAFCNAGFDITGDSFSTYRYNPGIFLVIMPLIIIGGLGFPVLGNFYAIFLHRIKKQKSHGPMRFGELPPVDLSNQRMTLHTKIVLTTTAALFILGVLGIAIGELMPYVYTYTQQGVTAHVERPADFSIMRVAQILADSSFMSISSRTAGFYSINTQDLHPTGHLVLISLMLVGGSPGSTAGGVKTTVIALLFLSIIANMRQREDVEAFGRTIGKSAIQKAGTLFFCYAGLILTSTYLLTLSEPFTFLKVFFEVVSAATTTGLSLGITSDLSSFGKIVIIGTMFLGRVGPLALLGALVLSTKHKVPYAYPHEDVVLG